MNVLEAEEASRYASADGSLQIILVKPTAGLESCLVSRPGGGRLRFNEDNVGLDHLEFLVESRSDLDQWAAHLDELGVSH
jgi:glyoxylase I family protein